MRRCLIGVVVYASFLIATPVEEAGAAQEPIDAAKAYIAGLKTGAVREAVLERWDADALLAGAFGLTYLELPPAERERAQGAFADFVAAPFANPRLMQHFRSIEIKEAVATQVDESTVAVRLDLTGDAGRFQARNTLLLKKRGDDWLITDQRQADQPSIRVALVMTYAGTANGPADTIPVVLERVAADTRRQVSER